MATRWTRPGYGLHWCSTATSKYPKVMKISISNVHFQSRLNQVHTLFRCRTNGRLTTHFTTWRSISTRPPRPSSFEFQTSKDVYKAKNRTLLMYTSAIVRCPTTAVHRLLTFVQIITALGITYASVPLYRMFCAATGFAGTPNVGTGRFAADRLVPIEGAPRIKVHFNADRSKQLPWSFTPQQKFVTVLPGETSLAFYKAKNLSKWDIIGIATYNVTPDRVSHHTIIRIH